MLSVMMNFSCISKAIIAAVVLYKIHQPLWIVRFNLKVEPNIFIGTGKYINIERSYGLPFANTSKSSYLSGVNGILRTIKNCKPILIIQL